MRLQYSIFILCRALDVSPSGYYDWLKRPESTRQKDEERLELEIKAAHKRTRETYGPERLQEDLAEQGVVVGVANDNYTTPSTAITFPHLKTVQ